MCNINLETKQGIFCGCQILNILYMLDLVHICPIDNVSRIVAK
jgi:hypothetical protein